MGPYCAYSKHKGGLKPDSFHLHVIISRYSSTSRCYVDLWGCNRSRNTNIQYIHVYNFDAYVPITVILLMLSDNSLL